LELPTCLYASARRPILSTDATTLVVRSGTPLVGPHGRSGSLPTDAVDHTIDLMAVR
jgi:hypothetical protein